METVEHLVIGAGPAGLRAAQVLAEAGREVLVLEKNLEVGPKTCAGGLTRKAVRELAPLGLPPTAGLARVGYVAFTGATPRILDAVATTVRTVPRRDLGRFQLEWGRRGGHVARPRCTYRLRRWPHHRLPSSAGRGRDGFGRAPRARASASACLLRGR